MGLMGLVGNLWSIPMNTWWAFLGAKGPFVGAMGPFGNHMGPLYTSSYTFLCLFHTYQPKFFLLNFQKFWALGWLPRHPHPLGGPAADFGGSCRSEIGSKIDSDISRLLGMIKRWSSILVSKQCFCEVLNSFLASKLPLDTILGVFREPGPCPCDPWHDFNF